MMTLKDVTDFFKLLNTTNSWGIENFYRGKLDNKKDKSLGLYDISNIAFEANIGGPENNVSREIYVSLLIHWTDEYSPCEEVGNKIYQAIIDTYDYTSIEIGTYKVNYFELLSGNEDVGTDENGIYERVIEFKINYDIKENV